MLAVNVSASSDTIDIVCLKTQAAQGDDQAQCELARRYEHGVGLGQSDRKALHWYRQPAEQNVAKAQYNVGRLFGARQYSAEAVVWFLRAASWPRATPLSALSLP